MLREYLYLEFKGIKLPFKFEFEKILDDFVFLCFFVGNDFLPHLPSLSIREGALDALIFIYKHLLPSMGGYLNKGAGDLDLRNVDILLGSLSQVEEDFFKQHQKNAKFHEERRKKDEEREKYEYERKKNVNTTDQPKEPVRWRNDDKRGGDNRSTAAPTEIDVVEYERKQMTGEELEKNLTKEVMDKINKEELDEEEKQKLIAT